MSFLMPRVFNGPFTVQMPHLLQFYVSPLESILCILGQCPCKMDNRTIEILKRFDDSWNKTLGFYDDLIDRGWAKVVPVKEFLTNLDRSGGRRLFRVGTSVFMLKISRSVMHGLRSDQKYIRVDPINANDFEVTMADGEKLYRQYRVKDLGDPRITKLLKTLESLLID